MSWARRNRIRLIFASILVFSFLIFNSHMKELPRRNALDRALLWITAPVQYAVVWSIDGLTGTWKSYVYLVGLHDENRQLEREVLELRRRNALLTESALENQRLKKLLHMRADYGGLKVVAARVIGVGTSPLARTIRIYAGADQGLQEGDAVVSGSGLVGRVEAVSGGYAEVRLVVDGRSAVDVVIQRSRARGIVRGRGEDELCSVDYLVRTADVKVGDKVVTSGVGSMFPAGLLVGVIESVTSPDVGVFRKAEIHTVVAFQTMEEVMVMISTDRDQPGGLK